MSFSQEVKEELIGVRLRHEEDGKKLVSGASLAAATLKFSRQHRTWGLQLVSESEKCISFIAKLASRSYELSNEIALNVHERLKARNTELFLYGKGLDSLCADAGLISFDEHGEKSYVSRIPDGLDSDHALRAFVRGVFLMCGYVSDPEKSCHAEMIFKNEIIAGGMIDLLSARGIPPKLSRRRNQFVAYIKSGDTVEDFLTFMGAGESMLRLSEQRMIREAANNTNREVNCLSANLEKAARASASQIADIELVLTELGPDAMSEEVYEAARARMEYPELTLSELAERLLIGKSAVNYRLRKIAKLAEEIKNAKDRTERMN